MRYLVKSVWVGCLAAMVVAAGCCGSADDGDTAAGMEESQATAEEYVLASPTYTYDGVEDSVEVVGVNRMDVDSPGEAGSTAPGEATSGGGCWEFAIEFECLHSGYGDRTGRFLLQEVTPHTAMILVCEGTVTSAALDGKWDMVTQTAIDGG